MPPISAFDMLKIGIGPSSSHTMGPWRAMQRWLRELEQSVGLARIDSIQIHLYGSLALTGRGHATDRALCLARGDTQPLPGFDETAYAATAGFDNIPFRDLVAEFDALRRANTLMLKNLPKEAWTRRGTVWNNPLTMNAQAYILAGHVQHHFNILKKRLT